MGCKVLLATINLEMQHLCHVILLEDRPRYCCPEIDALWRYKNIDKTYIQMKMLNTGKGPAGQILHKQIKPCML